ncbi:hypothetical protein [Oceaniglobus roseus]|uniref:hypothetical protein n=1 Tax=Oceaniglobus roseus TaxID=1737570 RepID=UPI0012FFDF27|nr:hypothetical protein [Kandeliimicrobium roseum]
MFRNPKVPSALAGFAAGVAGMLILAAFSAVVYSGHGFGQPKHQPAPIYTDY